MDISLRNISFDKIVNDDTIKRNVNLTIARLDRIHDDVSGNKLFKLHYFVEECLKSLHKTLLTFGGAFSNHLAATAFLCKQKGIKSIGIVRGEEAKILSHTLARCKDLGMILKFISRQDYKDFRNNEEDFAVLKNLFGDATIVPEGGYNAAGANGASLIMIVIEPCKFSHICTPVGTATTLAGLLLKKQIDQEIIAIPVIKNMFDIPERLNYLGVSADKKPIVFGDYHFGGYAKHTKELISFMNLFYAETHIPTDFVYTAKMMFGIYDNIKNGYFKPGSNILCIHTGGLQGNRSLPKGTLIF
jgi:1-aminocyclopropane-1-carboxylate deaminase